MRPSGVPSDGEEFARRVRHGDARAVRRVGHDDVRVGDGSEHEALSVRAGEAACRDRACGEARLDAAVPRLETARLETAGGAQSPFTVSSWAACGCCPQASLTLPKGSTGGSNSVAPASATVPSMAQGSSAARAMGATTTDTPRARATPVRAAMPLRRRGFEGLGDVLFFPRGTIHERLVLVSPLCAGDPAPDPGWTTLPAHGRRGDGPASRIVRGPGRDCSGTVVNEIEP